MAAFLYLFCCSWMETLVVNPQNVSRELFQEQIAKGYNQDFCAFMPLELRYSP